VTTARPVRSAQPVRNALAAAALAAAVLALAAPAAAPALDVLRDRDHASSPAPLSASAGPNGQDWGWE
jgi:hypothetical protein